MPIQPATQTAACPECDGPIEFARRPIRGEIAVCASCAAELEVQSVEPLVLNLAPEVEEDWGE